MRHWYLVYSKPRAETQARLNLTRQGFTTYLPLVRQTRRQRGRRVVRVEPLFPRYLFVQLDPQVDNWSPIRSTLGVSNLVRFGGEAVPVPDDLVEVLLARGDEQGIHLLPPLEFTQGERVRVKEGPLMGYEGIFIARSARERVLLLLDIVGGAKGRVNVDASHVERAH